MDQEKELKSPFAPLFRWTEQREEIESKLRAVSAYPGDVRPETQFEKIKILKSYGMKRGLAVLFLTSIGEPDENGVLSLVD